MVENKEKELKEKKIEEKVETKEVKKVKEVKKDKKEVKVYDKAVANGFGLKISTKYSKFVCRMIRGKTPEMAIIRLKEVINMKRPVPMAGLEVAHQKGKGLAGAKFPKNVCVAIMEIVKQAGANAVVLGIENPVIAVAMSNQASRPFRKAGRKAKRTHVYIEIRDKVKMMEAKNKGKNLEVKK